MAALAVERFACDFEAASVGSAGMEVDGMRLGLPVLEGLEQALARACAEVGEEGGVKDGREGRTLHGLAFWLS